MAYGDQAVAPIPDPLPQNEQTKILAPQERWTDDYARRIVRTDFAYAEAYRTHAHDWRYRNASELYLAWAGQRYWDGTRVPRSSIGIYVVFEQVESMLPKVVGAICDPESYNFYPKRSDQLDAALAWKRLVLEQLGEINYREHLRRVAKSSFIYGNGILEVGVENYLSETVEFSQSHRIKKLGFINHPIMGSVPIPQSVETSYSRKIHTETKLRPYIRYTSVIDFYVDPNAESPSLQDETCGYVIKRVYLHADTIKGYKGTKGFNVPPDSVLAEYSKAKTTANQDVTKLSTELFRYNMWNPSQDYSGDPSQKRIEAMEYTTRGRKVWLLNRDWVFYNQQNKYGDINYYSMHYADVLDRWHALAISDVAEGEQRLQQSIINARVDELALSIHRPMVKRRGVTIPPYQLKVRPGVVIETEVPEGDIRQLEVQNITQQAFIEVEASERRTQRITGMSDLAALGSPTSGGNSANRTAAGVNTQVGATQDRARYYIENAEAGLIEPMLNAVIRYDKKFLDMAQAAAWIRLDPDFNKLDPLEVMNAEIVAECRASIKMAGRQGFLSVLPQLSQIVFNPELLQMLAQQQKKTVDVAEFERMIWDAINYTPRNPILTDMKPEQIQAMQQPPPAEKLRAQIEGQKMAVDTDVHNKQNITKLAVAMLKEFLKHGQKMAELDDKHAQALLAASPAAGESQDDAGGGQGDNQPSGAV